MRKTCGLWLIFYKSTKLRTTTDAIREYITVSMRQCDFGIKELQPYTSIKIE